MALDINIKHILLFIYEYFLFIKEELFSNKTTSIYGSKQPNPTSTVELRTNQDIEASDEGTPLAAYQKEYKTRVPHI